MKLYLRVKWEVVDQISGGSSTKSKQFPLEVNETPVVEAKGVAEKLTLSLTIACIPTS